MARSTLFMETTKINAKRSAAQVSEMLGECGANAVLTEYDGGKITAVSFRLRVGGNDLAFRLPVRTDAVRAILKGRRKRSRYDTDDKAKAERIAWRQAMRWLEAQLAYVETGMVKMEEVFLPYMLLDAEKTLYQKLAERGFKMLPAPSEKKE